MVVKLTKKDKALLAHLDENSRYTNTQLAKKTGVSVSNVTYKISRMLKEEIVKEFYILLNPFSFKKRYDRLVIQFRSDWNREEVREYCQKNSNIGWFIFLDGTWNFGCQIWSDTIEETKEILDEFLSRFSKYINQYVISSLISIEKFEHNFLFEEFQSKYTAMRKVPEAKLDELDKRIINLMFRNARMKLLEVAKKLSVDYKIISYRLKRLEKENVIIGYKTQFNRFNLGYDYYKIRITYASHLKQDIRGIKEFLRRDKRILFITEALGWADLEFEIFCKNQEEYRKFQENFKRKFATKLREYETLIPLEFGWNHIMPVQNKPV